MVQKLSLCTESNAFIKSTKWVNIGALHLFACSRMFLRINICSVVPIPGLNIHFFVPVFDNSAEDFTDESDW